MKPVRQLTPAQMSALKPHESYLRTMVYSGWARNITTAAYKDLKAVLDAKTGKVNHIDAGCGTCVADMLRTLGRWYFETREAEAEELALQFSERAARENARAAQIRIDAAEAIKKDAEKKLAAANARLAEVEKMKAAAALELKAARAARDRAEKAERDTAERIAADVIEAEKLRRVEPAAEVAEFKRQAGQISTQTPEPGDNTPEPVKAAKSPENKAKPARLPRNVKPKTN